MRICEIFLSIQGEGIYTGIPSVFVRVAGCNLNCPWCDSAYANNPAEGSEMTVEEVADSTKRYEVEHVVITGGEPMIYANEIQLLCEDLNKSGKKVTIETNSTLFPEGIFQSEKNVDCNPHLLSLSPKLYQGWDDKIIKKFLALNCKKQIKIVVDSIEEAIDALNRLKGFEIEKENIFLMPNAIKRDKHIRSAAWLVPFCCKNNVRFAGRLQTLLWDSERGK